MSRDGHLPPGCSHGDVERANEGTPCARCGERAPEFGELCGLCSARDSLSFLDEMERDLPFPDDGALYSPQALSHYRMARAMLCLAVEAQRELVEAEERKLAGAGSA
jgi:hypothetical protein